MTNGDDDRLAQLVRGAFPEPAPAPSLMDGVRVRARRRRGRLIAASSAAAAVVVGAAVAVPLTISGTGPSSSGAHVPGWALTCMRENHARGPLAPTYLGLTSAQLVDRTNREGVRIVVVARNGKCVTAIIPLVYSVHGFLYAAFDAHGRVAGAWRQR